MAGGSLVKMAVNSRGLAAAFANLKVPCSRALVARGRRGKKQIPSDRVRTFGQPRLL